MTIHAAISYGMGGDAIDRAASNGGGEDYFKSRLIAKKVDTLNSVYHWSDTQARLDDIRRTKAKDPTGKIALAGDSLGDNELGDDVVALKGVGIEVDLIGGFQGSLWGKHTSISDNVKRAILIYNPNVLQTAGLGAYPLPLDVPPVVPVGHDLYDGGWYLGNNGKTWVRYVKIFAAHPDDWGQAQDIVFNEIMKLAA